MTEKRVALLIANYQYEDDELRQLVAPAQDAEGLAAVLADPGIGGFEVETLLNEPSYRIRLSIEEFFDDRKRRDLLLLYISGHGIKDADGKLYFATADTRRKLLRATAVSAAFVNEIMHHSRSRRQVLLLDCCYSGAFARGMFVRADQTVSAGEYFQEGRGHVVLTASDAMQYAFEGEQIKGEGIRSVFTRALINGLATGKADIDEDGQISVDELYDYLYDRVTDQMPEQKPRKWVFDLEGEIIIARNPNPAQFREPRPQPKQVTGAKKEIEDVAPATGEKGKSWSSLAPSLPLRRLPALGRLKAYGQRTVQARPHLFLWLAWVVAGALGWTAGWALIEDGSGLWHMFGETFSWIVFGTLFGAGVGTTQWLVLRQHLKRAHRWVFATFAGVTIGWAAFQGISWAEFGAPTLTAVLRHAAWVFEGVSWVVFGALFGTSAGLAQWLVLRQRFDRAHWWILASTAGWAAGFSLVANLPPPYELVPTGTLAGAITGIALVWLLRRPRSHTEDEG